MGEDKTKASGSASGSRASFEDRLMKKMSSSNLGRSVGAGGNSRGSDASFEERLQRKAREGSSSRRHSPSPGKISSTSSTQRLDDLEARIQAKSKAEDTNKTSGSASESHASFA